MKMRATPHIAGRHQVAFLWTASRANSMSPYPNYDGASASPFGAIEGPIRRYFVGADLSRKNRRISMTLKSLVSGPATETLTIAAFSAGQDSSPPSRTPDPSLGSACRQTEEKMYEPYSVLSSHRAPAFAGGRKCHFKRVHVEKSGNSSFVGASVRDHKSLVPHQEGVSCWDKRLHYYCWDHSRPLQVSKLTPRANEELLCCSPKFGSSFLFPSPRGGAQAVA
jgi:hypothetical protein